MNAQSSRTGVPACDLELSGILDARLGVEDLRLCRCSNSRARDCDYHRAYDYALHVEDPIDGAERRRVEARALQAIREMQQPLTPGMFAGWPKALKAAAGYAIFGALTGVPAAFLLLRLLGLWP